MGSITAPGLTLLPPTVAAVKQAHPNLHITIQIEPSNVLIERLNRGTLDMLVGRLSPEHDKAALRYESVSDEPICAVARPGHPLLTAVKPYARRRISLWLDRPTGGQRIAPSFRHDDPGARLAAANQLR